VKRITHLSLDIRGALRWDASLLRRTFLLEDGTHMTADQAREALRAELEQGRLMLPIGVPCEGFSYETGCPGHPVDHATEDHG